MDGQKKISILIVDDSYLIREYLQKILSRDSELEVVGQAQDGREAVELAEKLKPSVILMDCYMPKLNGIEATEKIMASSPCPILLLSSNVDDDENLVLEMLSKGALDAMQKPKVTDIEECAGRLIEKIKILSGVSVVRRVKRTGSEIGNKIEREVQDMEKKPAVSPIAGPGWERKKTGPVSLVAIASSTGGPRILQQIVSKLPPGFPPVIIVQHINADFTNNLVKWLNESTKNSVLKAGSGVRPKRGEIYIAPENYHLVVNPDLTLSLQDSDMVNWIKPSADVLFSSIAGVYGKRAVGIVLTGMGEDGAKGLKVMHENGAVTMVQDEQTSVVFGMPKAAIDLNCVDYILSPDEIVEKLKEFV